MFGCDMVLRSRRTGRLTGSFELLVEAMVLTQSTSSVCSKWRYFTTAERPWLVELDLFVALRRASRKTLTCWWRSARRWRRCRAHFLAVLFATQTSHGAQCSHPFGLPLLMMLDIVCLRSSTRSYALDAGGARADQCSSKLSALKTFAAGQPLFQSDHLRRTIYKRRACLRGSWFLVLCLFAVQVSSSRCTVDSLCSFV